MIRSRYVAAIVVCGAMLIAAAGCGVSQQQYEDLQAQNRIQQNRIGELEAQVIDCNHTVQQKQQHIDSLGGRAGADMQARNALIAALEADLEEKKALIAKLQTQLLEGGAPLPLELNVLLQEFARASDMIDFDEATGSLKFKSDLLFDRGSDQVKVDVAESLKQLAEIMNTSEAKQFDLVVIGHTDDMPIRRAETRQAHPTNWHLSAHRAISVVNHLSQNQIDQERMAVKGHGEFKPIEPNRPNKGGNPVNRRVEIFIVPSVR